MRTMNKALALNLRMLRGVHCLHQETIAALLGIGQTTYSAYEQGRHTPPLDMLIQIADLYGVSIDWLVGRCKHEDAE